MKTIVALFAFAFAAAHATEEAGADATNAQAEQVFNTMLPLGQQMLEHDGKFDPFGGALTTDGTIVSVAAENAPDHTSAQRLIETTASALHSGAASGKYLATAIFYETKVAPPGSSEKTEAIAVALDQKGQYSAIVYVPYTISDGKVNLGTAFASPGEHKIFDK